MRIQPRMLRRSRVPLLVVGLILMSSSQDAGAQAPTILEGPLTNSAGPGGNQSLLGTLPGSGGATMINPGVSGGQILGGRPGASTPRVPTSVSTPGAGATPTPPPMVLAIPNVPALTAVPLFGNLELAENDGPGPADGLTFDTALDLMIRNNLDLAARRFEIPAAQADILTASLRANPILYADGQLVPYGKFDPVNRPGGQTQYDVNISYPIDYSRKRQARTKVAIQAKRAIEAQFQDAIRLQINNLSNAYLSVLAARETVRYAATGLKGLDTVVEKSEPQISRGNRTSADVARIIAQRESAAVGLDDAEEALRRAKRTLGTILNIPPIEAETLEIRASLREDAPSIPTGDELIGLALTCRPDVVSFRIGVEYAKAGLTLQKANKYADAYVLLQPYTFQNNAPTHQKSAHSYAVGFTVPLPLYNRNQGNIERAKININQSQTQLDALIRQVVTEVRQAEREYVTTKNYLDRLESTVLPASKKAVDDTRTLFNLGELTDVTLLFNVQRESNDIVRQYRDTAVRHRRSMFNLNTAVGQRILP